MINPDMTLSNWIESHSWIGVVSAIIVIAILLSIIFIVKRIVPPEDDFVK